MKWICLFLVVILMVGCTQVELYDEYNKKWNLDLQRPLEAVPGQLVTSSNIPRGPENFDLYLQYNAVGDFSEKSFWIDLGDEERHQLISDLSKAHGTKGVTAEGNRKELEDLLGIDLGPQCKAFIKQQYRQGLMERIILLQSTEGAKIYLIHLIDN